MENNVILSIIIPFYNVEEYIERCLNSIVSQPVLSEQFEIIAINDGSKDKSLDIAEQIAKQQSNMIVVSQENKGQSAARNHGVRLAHGKYIWYVDSDDWIEEGCLTHILPILKESDVDLFNFGHKNWFDGELIVTPHKSGKIGILCVGHFYKRSFLIDNDIWFVEGIYHEDLEYCPRVCYLAKKQRNLSLTPYIIYKRPQSTTTGYNPKKAFDLLVVARHLAEFAQRNKIESANFIYYIALALNDSLQNVYMFEMDKGNEEKLNMAFYENRDLFVYLWKSKILKYKIEYLVFIVFSKHCVQLFKLMKHFNFRDFSQFKQVNSH